jgi:uncharacterized membrane protein YdjX (TVP38/TMEM64 family)
MSGGRARAAPPEAGANARRRWRLILGVAAAGAIVAACLLLQDSDLAHRLTDAAALERLVARVGPAGPALIVGAMTLAVVVSPVPSAPIALAAGAAYGHLWGTLYVAAGAEAGALVAFGLARLVGYEAVRTWLWRRPSSTFLERFLGSQNRLMLAVLASRLLPFLSFDVVSYAAGLTPIKAWRFAVATLLGVVPASFLLAHFGAEVASGELYRAGSTVLALGLVTLLPFLWRLVPGRRRTALLRSFRAARARPAPLPANGRSTANKGEER